MSTLDDFFAKKDRKKKGIKDGDKPDQKDGEKKRKDITDNLKNFINQNEDDEWLDFEENRDKDYSGLKIQALTLKDKSQLYLEQQENELADESKDAPWSAKTASTTNNEEEEEVKKEEEQKEPEPVVVKKYIPPSLRSNVSEVPKKVAKNKAPEIKNESEFPTLG